MGIYQTPFKIPTKSQCQQHICINCRIAGTLANLNVPDFADTEILNSPRFCVNTQDFLSARVSADSSRCLRVSADRSRCLRVSADSSWCLRVSADSSRFLRIQFFRACGGLQRQFSIEKCFRVHFFSRLRLATETVFF